MKKNNLLRGITLVLCFILAFSLAACKAAPEEETGVPDIGQAAAAEREEQEAEPTPEPTPEPTAEPAPDPVLSGNISPLTGLATLTDEAVGKRPVAVMINNVAPALPQDGVSYAEVLFEMPLEYEHTRLMGLFSDYTQIPKICSVRSCRYYYPIMAAGFDAIYVHWGADEIYARPVLNALNIDTFDGIYGGLGFARDQQRLDQGKSAEHTGYMDGSKFPEMVADMGYRMDIAEGYEGDAFCFAEYEETAVPTGDAADFVKINFGAQNSSFIYDADTKLYKKLYNGEPHIDALNNEQLAFTNVIVLETEIYLKDNGVHKNVHWRGGDAYKGYWFSEGKMQEITWSKADEFARLKFFAADGSELVINRGKTYIAVNYSDRITLTQE